MEKTPPLYRRVVKSVLRAVAKILFKVETKDLDTINENLKKSDKNIFVCNHPSFLDGIMLGLFLPCDPVFLVHTTILERPLFKFLLNFVDYLAIEPTSPMALKTLANTVNAGRPVVIFPEGRITVTGGLMKIYEGSAFIAAKTGANIIPITLQGLLKSKISRMGHTYPRSWFPQVSIMAHEPVKITTNPEMMAKVRRKDAGEQLRRILQHTGFKSISTDQSIYKTFTQSLFYFGGKHVVIEELDRSEITYDKLNMMIQGLGYLTSKLTQKGEYVGLLLPNTPACAAAFIGLTAYARVPAMLNYTMSKDAFISCLKSATIKTIITSKQFIEKGKLFHLVEAAQSAGVNVVYLEELKEKITFSDKITIKLRSISKWHETVTPDQPATVLFTSGSEGTPKGVVLSHKAILSNIAQIRSIIDIVYEDKVCNVLPMFHSFGLTAGTLLPIIAGTKLLLYVSPLHYRVVPELIYDRNCTVMFGTNTFLFNYAKNAHNYDFYKLRYVVAGAEKVSEQTRNMWFEKFGLRILEGYGATECAPVISVNTPMANRFGTVGQFLPGMKHQLESISGVTGGKLLVSGPNLMSGYLKDDKPGILQPCGEWYDTGDIVSLSDDGFVTIQGRVKRFVKIAGEMVSLEVVDKIVGFCTDKLFATSSRPDINKGEQIVLFTLDDTLTKDKIRTVIAEKNQSNLMMPNEIRLITEIPLLGAGKIDYVKLKSMI
jgi:acyl-[acyl-carrier-protein]-phospholipid O-acyltransferase/long-chain-fatty-acid--[acyl-carrier-protein] ligase